MNRPQIVISIDEFFQMVSEILKCNYEFSECNALIEHVKGLKQQLNFMTYNSSESLYGFIEQEHSEVRTKYVCQCAHYAELDRLIDVAITGSELQRLYHEAGLPNSTTFETVILNTLFQVNEICQQSLLTQGKAMLPLLEASAHFFNKPPIEFEECQKEHFKHKYVYNINDIFCNVFNTIFKPEILCLTSGDINNEMLRLTQFVNKEYSCENLAVLLRYYLLKPEYCNCQFTIQNIIVSSSLSLLLSSSKYESKSEEQILQKCIKLLRSLCVLREFLTQQIYVSDNNYETAHCSLIQLLKVNKTLKCRLLEQNVNNEQPEVAHDSEDCCTDYMTEKECELAKDSGDAVAGCVKCNSNQLLSEIEQVEIENNHIINYLQQLDARLQKIESHFK